MDKPFYNYKSLVTNVSDYNTVDLKITIGFRMMLERRVFVHGIRCPELDPKNPGALTGAEARKFAESARLFLESFLKGRRVIASPKRPNLYGRVRVNLFMPCESMSIDYPHLTRVVLDQRYLVVANLANLAAMNGFDNTECKSILEQIKPFDVQ